VRTSNQIIIAAMLLVSFAVGQVTIDGYAYLENQTDHGEITITFARTAPSALTETITTDADGYYSINLETGIYDITYSKIEYFSESLIDQSLYSNVTFDPLTMLEHTSLINVPSLFTTIQLAIDYASNGDTILVQPGTYEENINYSGKNIVIGSLYLTTQDTSYISSTIIDGSNAGTVVTFNSGEESTAKLCGFTIQNGNANKGGGISCFSSSRPTLTDLRLIDNSSSAGGGGGLYCEVASPSLFNVLIKNNLAPNGGGIHFEHTPAPHPNLLNVEISNNVGTNLGGGIFLISSNPIISHSTIVNNSSPEGSGINNYSNASPVIRNSIIANNSGSWGINIQNNTSITYSTFYGNESGDIIGDTWVGQNMITNVNGDSCDIYFNIQEDPLFVDASVNNYNLQQTSPCIDAGDPTSPYDADGSIADMGAYPSPYGTPVPIVIEVPNDYATIQAGLIAASTNDTVLVQPGTYYENIIWPQTNGITLKSAGDSSNTIIDGDHIGRVLFVDADYSLIEGFTIQNGAAVNSGSGILLSGIDNALVDVAIRNNVSNIYSSYPGDGGGLSINGNNATLHNCQIIENINGGLNLINSSSIIGDNITIQNNTMAGLTGSNGSNITLSNSTISNNDGNGIRLNQCPVYLSNVKILNNDEYGFYSSIPNGSVVDSSVFANNNYDDIYLSMPLGIQISNNTFSGTSLNAVNIYRHPSTDGNVIIQDNLFAGMAGIITSSQIEVSQNNFTTGGWSLVNSNSNHIQNGVDNYWGHSSGPYHPNQNPDGMGDSTNAFTNVTPWLTTPNTVAPPVPAQNVHVSGTGNDFINLNWDSSPLGDFAGFKLYYDTDESGYPYGSSVDIGSSNTYALTGLNLGTEYFLAVTVYDTDGNESWYSNEVTGITRVMEVQNLDIAGDEQLYHLVTHDPLITFDYFDSMGETQTNYHIQISTDSTFQSNLNWDSGEVVSDATSIQYTEGALLDGVNYYLRAKVASGSFWSEWTNLAFGMNSVPSVPLLISPTDNLVVDAPINLIISSCTDAEIDPVSYQYFVFDDNSREVFIDSSSWISDTSWQITETLTDNNQFWWYARSFDGFEMSELANASSFLVNTENNAPGNFTLTYPSDESEVTTLEPTFTWASSIDPDPIDTVSYTLLLETPDPGIITVDVGNITSWQFTELLEDNTEYFWKVVATDLLGFETENTGGYSMFTTNEVNENPTVVDLYSPDSVMVLSLTPEMIWSPAIDPDPRDSVYYELHWWGVNIQLDSTLSDTNIIVLPRALEDNTQYFWEVVAMDQTDGISHSETATFWTDLIAEAPGGFALLSPNDDVSGLSDMPSFEWEPSNDPDPLDFATYTIQIATDSNFVDVVFDANTELDIALDMTEALPADTEYWWRVVATDTDSLTTESETFKFTVGYVSIAEAIALPTEYMLDQNFPNPFNPSTTLRYGLPKDSEVSVVIYDIRGNAVRTIESGAQVAGWYEQIWNGMNDDGQPVSTGLYLTRLRAGSYTKTIKMLYLK
jgi:hypothetical protein